MHGHWRNLQTFCSCHLAWHTCPLKCCSEHLRKLWIFAGLSNNRWWSKSFYCFFVLGQSKLFICMYNKLEHLLLMTHILGTPKTTRTLGIVSDNTGVCSVPLLVASSSKPSHCIIPLSKINASPHWQQHKVIECVHDVRVGLVDGQNNLTHMGASVSCNAQVSSGPQRNGGMYYRGCKLYMEHSPWKSPGHFPQQQMIFSNLCPIESTSKSFA